MAKLTLKNVRTELASLGVRIRSEGYGEYRVYFAGCATFEESERTAYYTDDLTDALSTGKVMHALRSPKHRLA